MQTQQTLMKTIKKNQQEIKKLAKILAEFKPTIIVIEDLPKNDSIRQISYLEYLKIIQRKNL